jgi:methyl-accepting chemotaxis protein
MNFQINTIKSRLLTITFIGLAVLAITAIAATRLLSAKNQEYDSLLTNDVAIVIELSNMNRDFKTQVQEWKNVLLRGTNDKDREKYWQRFLSKQELIQDQASQLLSKGVPPEIERYLLKFKSVHNLILPKYKQGYSLFVENQFNYKMADKSVRGIDREPSQLLSKSVSETESLIKAQSEALSVSSKQYQYWTLLTVLTAILLVTWFISNTITRKVTNPLSTLIKQITRVSAGQFDRPLELSSNDEIGHMSIAIEKVRLKMFEVNQQLCENQSELNMVSDNISQNADLFTSKANAQYQQALDINAATKEMSEAGNMMSSNITQANNIAESASHSTHESRDVMQTTLASIKASSQQIRRTSEVISQLDEDVKNVGSVVEVINSIADQTNLLALNAAIEAARAGEQGRGFAVVADEVRTLASRTQQSTEEIKTIIAKLQERALGAVNAIQEGEASVSASEESINKAAEVLNQVDNAVQQITQRNLDIANTLTQQKSLNTTIDNRVETVRQSADDNKKQSNELAIQNTRLETVRHNLEVQLLKLAS